MTKNPRNTAPKYKRVEHRIGRGTIDNHSKIGTGSAPRTPKAPTQALALSFGPSINQEKLEKRLQQVTTPQGTILATIPTFKDPSSSVETK